MSDPVPDRQILAAREVIAHIAQHLEADLSVQLWDGTVLPLGPEARDDICLIIASPKAIRRLLLKPGLMTLFELYGLGELGIDNHDQHFEDMRRLLKPRGRYLHQASVRRAPFDLSAFRKPTAYQKALTRFIFPGGELDHIGMTVTNLERHGFEVHDVENWREHFQLTLEHWTARLAAREVEAIAEIGAARTRLWLLYMSLFAVAFERGTCLVYQTLATKRQVGPSRLPLTRGDLYG